MATQLVDIPHVLDCRDKRPEKRPQQTGQDAPVLAMQNGWKEGPSPLSSDNFQYRPFSTNLTKIVDVFSSNIKYALRPMAIRFSGSLNARRYVAVSDNNVELTEMMAASPFLHGEDAAEATEALHDLPSPDTRRWVVRRKAVVVQAVRSGTITLQEACRRYSLSVEEFLAWQRAIDRYGIPGLRVTRLQIYRDTDEARAGK